MDKKISNYYEDTIEKIHMQIQLLNEKTALFQNSRPQVEEVESDDPQSVTKIGAGLRIILSRLKALNNDIA